jgi:FkbM family methyltransferase
MRKKQEENNMQTKFKVIDLFSGCGGFSYGFESAGFHVVLGVDNDKAALETFKANHANSKTLLADLHQDQAIEDIINQVEGHKIDVIIAGPPCQGFSLTGARNRSDDRNKVMLSIKKGEEYINENKVEKIDFLKIDTEGFELHVLKGFGDFLRNVKYIQFEYGGTFMDNHTKLIDVVDYLRQFYFVDFGYLHPEGIKPIQDFSDHYQYCNIVCRNKNL